MLGADHIHTVLLRDGIIKNKSTSTIGTAWHKEEIKLYY